MAAASVPAAPSVRGSRLREVATHALDETLAACTAESFCDGFASEITAQRADVLVLQNVYDQAQACLRQNALVSESSAVFAATSWIPFSCRRIMFPARPLCAG
jgi:hypothetical protein